MSGPKLSAAEIERMRKEQLERERLEALRLLREAQNVYRQACDRIGDTKRSALSLLNKVDAMYRNDAVKETETILAKLRTEPVADEKDPQSYYAAVDSISKIVDKTIQDLDKCLNKYIKRGSSAKKLAKTDFVHQSFQAAVGLKTDPIDVSIIDFKSSFGRDQLMSKIDQVLMHYKWVSVHGESELLRQFASKSVNRIMSVIDKQTALKDTDIKSSVQAIINEESDMIRREAERDALYDEYIALATLLDIVPKPPADFTDVQAIKKEIADYDCMLRKKNEMDYIADQINDAMVSLGYGLITSTVLTRKDLSEMDYSLYQADDQTGIAVYTNQTGAVMMRMTVLGEDANITEDDRDFSLQRQIDFCAGHEDIVSALAERGVYLKQKNYSEPDKKHTYKVNLSAMRWTAQKDVQGRGVTNKEKIDRRKRRRAAKKKVRAL